MNYKKIVPAVALTVGVAASITAAQAESLFQLSEVSSKGTLIAEAEHHCGAKGENHKACEHKDGDKHKDAEHHKDGKHQCGAHKKQSKNSDRKCGANKKQAKEAAPQSASEKSQAENSQTKDADHKCAAGACGSDK
ncbi:hypothetical protein [Vampirovibrio chlorellavorus]|uniref:hypothetical protein n=1 Tax=Vampirovibrio chlorellavorus TaxID=758823 RepID=UPI0026E9EF52|nr:hypothetical protein [Vampirovibrio chlorellavorus]